MTVVRWENGWMTVGSAAATLIRLLGQQARRPRQKKGRGR
jgi:hypothetical protein